MRTSQIILVSTSGIIALFLFSLLIQKEEEPDRIDHISKQMTIPEISHLLIKEGCNVHLYGCDSNRIKTTYPVDAEIQPWGFSLKDDTLFIEMVPDNRSYSEIWIKNLNTITIQNSRLFIHKPCFQHFDLSSVGSDTYISGIDSLQLANINLKQKSKLQCNGLNLKSLQIKLNHSKAFFYIQNIEELQAELNDKSELSTKKVLKTDVKTDSGSRYYSR